MSTRIALGGMEALPWQCGVGLGSRCLGNLLADREKGKAREREKKEKKKSRAHDQIEGPELMGEDIRGEVHKKRIQVRILVNT